MRCLDKTLQNRFSLNTRWKADIFTLLYFLQFENTNYIANIDFYFNLKLDKNLSDARIHKKVFVYQECDYNIIYYIKSEFVIQIREQI